MRQTLKVPIPQVADAFGQIVCPIARRARIGAQDRNRTQFCIMVRLPGVDPGLRFTGWGVIEVDGNRLRHVADG